jgi:hypothetical protein
MAYKKLLVRDKEDPTNFYERVIPESDVAKYIERQKKDWTVSIEDDIPDEIATDPIKLNTYNKFAAKGFENPYKKNEFDSFARGALQGVSFGFADEIAGYNNDDVKKSMRIKDQLAQEGSPIAFGSGDIAGGIPMSVGGGLAVGKALKGVAPASEFARQLINSPAAKAILGGATEGAISGLGQSTEGNMISSTLIGAGAGALGGAVGNKLSKSLGLLPEQSILPKSEIQSAKDKYLAQLSPGLIEDNRKIIKADGSALQILEPEARAKAIFGKQADNLNINQKIDPDVQPYFPVGDNSPLNPVSIAGDADLVKNIISDKYLRDLADKDMRSRMGAMRLTKADKEVKEYIYGGDFKTLEKNVKNMESILKLVKSNMSKLPPGRQKMGLARDTLLQQMNSKKIPKAVKDKINYIFDEIDKVDAPTKDKINDFIASIDEQFLSESKNLLNDVTQKVINNAPTDYLGVAGKQVGRATGSQIVQKRHVMPEGDYLPSPLEVIADESKKQRIEAIKYLIASGELTEADLADIKETK